MGVYRSKYNLLPGSSYDEVVAAARKEFNTIRKITKRQPYVRSKYFHGDKIFVTIFWDHLMQKHRGDRVHRLKLYRCAIDLLRNTTSEPDTIFTNDNLSAMLHRFYGLTCDGRGFCVQIRERVEKILCQSLVKGNGGRK